jgi:hypothetical protein
MDTANPSEQPAASNAELLQRIDRLIEVMTRQSEAYEALLKAIIAIPDDGDAATPHDSGLRRETLLDGTVIEF